MSQVRRHIGTVSAVNPKTGQARVRLPECDNLRTPWLNVLQRNTQNNKDYWLPDIGEQVEVLLDRNGEEGVILGAIYSSVDKPPVEDANARGITYADGAAFYYDRANHTLTIRGGIAHIMIETTGTVSIKTSAVHIEADNISLKGNIEVDGNLHATGNLLCDGQNANHHAH